MTRRFCWNCVSVLMPPCVPHTEHFQAQNPAKTVPPDNCLQEGYPHEKKSTSRGSFCFLRFDGTACYEVIQALRRYTRHDRSYAECQRLYLSDCLGYHKCNAC